MSQNNTTKSNADYSREFHTALGIPFQLPKYRVAVPIYNGKHSITYKIIMSHTPPSKKDVSVQRATPQNLFPTG